MMEARLIFMALICLVIAQLAFAAEKNSMLVQNYSFQTPELEQRYIQLIKQIRCSVCQNQSLFDSHSESANDMRVKIQAMLNAGMTDQQILGFMRSQFGDRSVFMPPLRISTLLLWLGPILMLGAAGAVCKVQAARKKVMACDYAC